MAASEFDKFIQRQQAKKQELEFDVGRQLTEWREHLATLYGMIEEYMSDYVKSGAAKTNYRPIELNEEFSGPYDVKQMSLTIGPSVILFKPIGTMLIGSKGRVDVEGPNGSARLVLVNKKISGARQLIKFSSSLSGEPLSPDASEIVGPIEWAWKLATPAPEMRFMDLDEQTFFNMILVVADA